MKSINGSLCTVCFCKYREEFSLKRAFEPLPIPLYRVATERLNDIKKNNFYKHMFFLIFYKYINNI